MNTVLIALIFSRSLARLKQNLLTRKRSIKDENVQVVLNGVDLRLFAPENHPKSDSFHHPFTVAYSGSYAKYQGIENIVEAAEILLGEDTHFKFMGFRQEDLKIKLQIKDRLKEKVTLLDWLPKRQLFLNWLNQTF